MADNNNENNAEREQVENAEREQRENAEREQLENAEREQRENAERERRENAEREQRENVEREQRENDERENRENAERRANHMRERQENAEREEREHDEQQRREQRQLQRLLRPATQVNIKSFSGLETENFTQFENLLRSSVRLTELEANQCATYLHLHLTGGALAFFDQLPERTQRDYEATLTALRARYNSGNRTELHKITFQALKFKNSSESLEDFLTDLQRLATLAFPNADFNRNQERELRIKDAFVQGMPNHI